MAIATGTAALISAGVGLVGTGISTAMSFSQASQQKKLAENAEREAAEKMQEARNRLEVNYADALSIQKEPYERQREALLSAGAQALEQGVESERGGAATAGRVLAAQTEAQGQIRDQMNKDLFDLEAMKAEEDSRLRDVNVQLDLGQAAGAQQAAAEAREKASLAKQQGIQGSLNFVQQGVGMIPLVGKGGTHNDKLFVPDAINTTPPSVMNRDLAQLAPNLFSNKVDFSQYKPPTTPFDFNPFSLNQQPSMFGYNYNPYKR